MRLLTKILILLLLTTPAYATNWCEDASAVACWTFAEGSGTLTDHSSNSNTGTLTDGASWSAISGTNAPSYANYMVTCDGDNDYINVSNDSSLVFETGDWTLVIWAIGDASQPDVHPASIGKGDTGSGEWMLRSSSGGNADFYGEAGAISIDYSSDYTSGEWVHIAVTVNPGTASTLYFNGVAGTPDATAADFDDVTDLTFCGADGDANRFWKGSVSEAALFNKILSEADINDIMDNGLTQSETGLVKPVLGTVVID